MTSWVASFTSTNSLHEVVINGFRALQVLPTELAERLAAEAERRGLSVSDLLIEYAEDAL